MPKMLLTPESSMQISGAQRIMLDQLLWSIRFSQYIEGTWSMFAALTVAATADDATYSGAVKPRLRWFKIGTRRSSSSRRGNALAVRWDSVKCTIDWNTSRAASRFAENSAKIKLCCSETGRKAFPPRRNTLRFSTRSGTRSKSTCV